MRYKFKYTSLVESIFSLITLKALNYLIPLVTLPYLINVLGIKLFGLIGFAESFIFYFNSIIEYGFNYTATRRISSNRDDVKTLTDEFNIVYSVKILLVFLCFLAFIIIIFVVPKFFEYKIILFASFGILIGYNIFPVWFFQGVEKMRYITILQFLARLIYACLIFLFIKSKEDYFLPPLFNMVGFILSGSIAIYIINKKYGIRFRFQSLKSIKNKLRQDFNIFASIFSPNLYNNSSTFLLGIFSGVTMVGYYQVATKIIDVLISFINSISTAFFPFLNRNKNKILFAFFPFVLIGMSLTVFVLLFSSNIIDLLFPNSLQISESILLILAISPLLISINSYFSINYLMIMNKDKQVRNITFACSIIGLLISIIAISNFGIYGAAFSLVFTRFLLALSNFTYSLKFAGWTIKKANLNYKLL
ncbi:MAG: oligosaccharide flippase family protein [bacterium]